MGAAQAGLCGLLCEGCFEAEHAKQIDPADEIVDQLIRQLFELQDLNGNGVLEEDELIQLNKKVAMLHKGKDIDKEEVRVRYQTLFRSRLDPEGEPVPLQTFRGHILDVLRGADPSKVAQTFILEQWVAEADLARCSFQMPSWNSLSDVPFLLAMPGRARPDAAEEEVQIPPAAFSGCDGAGDRGEPEAQSNEDGRWSMPVPPPSMASSLSKDAALAICVSVSTTSTVPSASPSSRASSGL